MQYNQFKSYLCFLWSEDIYNLKNLYFRIDLEKCKHIQLYIYTHIKLSMVSTKHENNSSQGGIFASISSFKWENLDGLASSENVQVHCNIGHPSHLHGNSPWQVKRQLHSQTEKVKTTESWPNNLEFSRGKVEPFTKLEIIKFYHKY